MRLFHHRHFFAELIALLTDLVLTKDQILNFFFESGDIDVLLEHFVATLLLVALLLVVEVDFKLLPLECQLFLPSSKLCLKRCHMHLLLPKGLLGIFYFLVPAGLPFAHLFLQVHILGASI